MRSRARQIGVLAAAVVAAVAWAGVATAQVPIGGKHLTVTPSHGTPSSRFVVNFTTTTTTGTTGGTIRTMMIRASGSNHAPSGCTNRIEQGVNIRRAGAQHVGLSAGSSGAHWCRGTFSGVVQEEIRPNCTPGTACPEYIAIETIGSFSFTVGAAAATDASAKLPVTPAG
jgi:hypothetical protein